MPQLDLSTYFGQVFWLLIFFGSFCAFVSFVFLPSINRVFDLRREMISKNLEDAKAMQLDFDNKLQRRLDAIADAKLAANNIVSASYLLSEQIYKEKLSIFAKEEHKALQDNNKKMEVFFIDSSEKLKRIAFDATLKYHSFFFKDSIQGALVDFNCLKSEAYKKTQDLLNKHKWQ